MATLIEAYQEGYYRRQIQLAKTQIESLKKQDEISKEQVEIMKKQNKIIEKQTIFTETLMIATVILALGTLLTLVLNIIEFEWASLVPRMGVYNGYFFTLCFLTYFLIMLFLVWRILFSSAILKR